MRSTFPGWAILAATLAALPLGCGQSRDRTDSTDKLRVAVSITPQAWLVERLGGDHVEVQILVQPGQSPATYQPSDAQISRVMGGDLYIRIGVPFERGGWFRAIREAESLRLVDQRRGIELHEMAAHRHDHHPADHKAEDDAPDSQDHDHDHDAAGKDPHIWLNPRLLKTQARTVAEALIQTDPAHESTYRSNLAELQSELDELHQSIRDRLEPYEGRTVLVFHPAWGYFLHEYGLRQAAIEIDGKTPSDRELTELQNIARKKGVRTIFVQPQVTGRTAEAVAEAIDGNVEQLDPLAPDVPTNLRHTAERIEAALTAPAEAPTGGNGS